MQIVSVYSDSEGESHFKDLDISIKDSGDIGIMSLPEKSTSIIFRETAEDYDYPWHNTPRLQYVIILEGGVDITTSDGETRRFAGGDVVRLEDLTGKGHYSKAVNGERRKSIFVTLD